MKVTVEKFNETLTSYMWDTVVPAVKSDIQRFVLGTVLGSGVVSLGGKWASLAGTVGVLVNGEVDTEVLRKAFSDGFRAAGDEVHIPDLGIWVSRSDLNGFVDKLEGGGGESGR